MELLDAPTNPFAHLFEDDHDADYLPGAGRADVDYTPFQEAPKARSRADHLARFALIRRQFPSTAYGKAVWAQILRERPGVFRALCVAVVEADAAIDNRTPDNNTGRYPHVSQAEMVRRLRRLFGMEYSFLPFNEAFRVLAKNRTLREIQTRIGDMNHVRVHRLLNGAISPTGEDMEAVAKTFGVHPSYFMEWRTAFVVAAIHDVIQGSPETSTSLYRKLIAG